MKKAIFLLILLLAGRTTRALDTFDDIANAIRSGDARQIATYFGNSVDLAILNQENVYSKTQAEQVIKDFFAKNPPKSFALVHKGSSPEGTQYAIGNLVSNSGKTFRASFYFKNIKGKITLLELRFESE